MTLFIQSKSIEYLEQLGIPIYHDGDVKMAFLPPLYWQEIRNPKKVAKRLKSFINCFDKTARVYFGENTAISLFYMGQKPQGDIAKLLDYYNKD